ncbi:unnamed protein product [Brassica rapa subsp. trilocularis]
MVSSGEILCQEIILLKSKPSKLRLPITGIAVVDILDLRHTVSSAIDSVILTLSPLQKGHDNACNDISTLGAHNANLWCQLPCRLFYFNSQINKFSNNSLFMCF